jgi:hypothetical protein
MLNPFWRSEKSASDLVVVVHRRASPVPAFNVANILYLLHATTETAVLQIARESQVQGKTTVFIANNTTKTTSMGVVFYVNFA